MQLAAIVVSLVITAVGTALFARAVGQIIAFVRLGKPVPMRQPHGRPGRAQRHAGQGVPRPHPDEPLGRHRLRPLVRRHRLPDPGADPRQRLRPVVRRRLAAAGDRRVAPVRAVRRVPRADDHARHPHAHRDPAAQPAVEGRPQVALHGLDDVAGVFRRVRHPRHRHLHPGAARAGGLAAPRRRLRGRLLRVVPGHRRGRRAEHRRRAEPRLPRRDDQDLDLLHLGARPRPQHHDGRGLAPLPRLPQHLVQAQRRRRGGPRRAPADGLRRQADRLRDRLRRRGRRGDRLRRQSGRALLVEGDPRLLHLYGVRPLPVAVPGLEHRQAAVAQAARHVAARARRRQGPVPPRRMAASPPRARRRPPRNSSPTCRPTRWPRRSAR